MKLKLTTIKDLKDFVSLSNSIMGRVVVMQNEYIVSGKSMLMMMGLNLESPIDVGVAGDDKVSYEMNYAQWLIK